MDLSDSASKSHRLWIINQPEGRQGKMQYLDIKKNPIWRSSAYDWQPELRKTECVQRGIHFPASHRQSAALTHSPERTVGLSVPEMEKEWFGFPAETHPFSYSQLFNYSSGSCAAASPQLVWPRTPPVIGQVFLLPPPPRKFNPSPALGSEGQQIERWLYRRVRQRPEEKV